MICCRVYGIITIGISHKLIETPILNKREVKLEEAIPLLINSFPWLKSIPLQNIEFWVKQGEFDLFDPDLGFREII